MFQINDSKLNQVVKLVPEDMSDKSFADIEDFVLADWKEGEEHQDWLNTASADEIADWVVAGSR